MMICWLQKKITGSDVSFVIPRRNWTTGTTYDIYRHDYEEFVTGSTSTRVTSNSGATTLFDATFYVLTSDRNVYKCLDNDGNTASTVEPTGTSTSVITTGDGYKWKYMYTLSQLNNQISYQLTLWQLQQTQTYHLLQLMAVLI